MTSRRLQAGLFWPAVGGAGLNWRVTVAAGAKRVPGLVIFFPFAKRLLQELNKDGFV